MGKNLLGKFQTMEFTSFAKLAKDSHIGALFGLEPQKASLAMVKLAGYERGYSFSLLENLPTKEFDTSDEYTWDVIGSTRQNIPLVEARDENGTVVTADSGNVGAGTAPFFLVFAKDWFADGEFIVGNLNELYQMRVLGDPIMEGTNAVYKVELNGSNEDGIPAERLLEGEKFSIEAAYVEGEMSREVGDIRYAAPVSMRNEFSHVRIKHKVAGNKLGRKIAVGLPMIGSDNKPFTSDYWMHYVDYQLELQFAEYKTNALAFGRSNRNSNGEYTNIGKSGNAIRIGAGLFQQRETGNTKYYTNFSLRLLEDALYDISYNQLDFKNRTFILRTGEKGAIQFHKAVTKEVSGWSMFAINGDAVGAVQKTSSPLHQNALRAGYQFVEYLAPNGVTIKLEVDPFYDDPVRNKIEHHLGGPAFSYRYDILDIGTMDQPNIFKCVAKNEPEYRGYQWGPFRNPFTGDTNNMSASFDEDAAVIHKYATLGICVLDPLRTMAIIPTELLG